MGQQAAADSALKAPSFCSLLGLTGILKNDYSEKNPTASYTNSSEPGMGWGDKMNLSDKENILVPTTYKAQSRPC